MSARKKVCALAIIMALELCIASCDGGGNKATAQTEPMADTATTTSSIITTTATATEAPTEALVEAPTEAPTEAAPTVFKVDILWYTFADTYLTKVRDAMEACLDEMPDVSYTMGDCDYDQQKQTQMVEDALTDGTDLLIVNIVTTGSEEAARNICDMAKAQDVPIIFFNREISDSLVNSYDKCCFVGTNADMAGYMQGQAIAEYLLSGGNLAKCDLDGDKEIKYIMFSGESGFGGGEAFGRVKYSVQEANRLLKGSGYNLAPSPANTVSTLYDDDGISNYFLYGIWSSAEAARLMRDALSHHRLDDGAIELVIANNDDMALGAIEAMNEAGYNTGEDGAGYIPVFGIDATADAQEAIAAGKMTGTVMQDAQGMAECVALLVGNVADGCELMSDTGRFTNIDAGVDKLRVPYVIFSS